jgi:hypothetical protein
MQMLKQISTWLNKISTGWVALIALIIFGSFIALVLPIQSAQTKATSNGADSPDMSFFYSADDLYQMAEAYGGQGRAAYIRVRFTFDLLWPLVYVFFLATNISWVNQKAYAKDSRWQLLNFAPLAAGLFDYLENICTALVMFRYPAHTPVVDRLAPLFTFAKWGILDGSFVILFVGIASAFVVYWEKQKEQS